MKRTLLAATCLIALWGAAAPDGYSTTAGAGTSSCGTWTRDHQENLGQYYSDENWVLGFLSGVGWANGATRDPLGTVPDPAAVAAWVDNWCSTRPASSILDAGAAFAIESTRHHYPDQPWR